ncbi:MAG: hypothetical protein PHC62_09590 [Candidatus Izemoplasmatales bacterium]|nr:hypothetical protein [Candidatus Izemoplasmatales bacterium]
MVKLKESNKERRDALDHKCGEWLKLKNEDTFNRVRSQSGGRGVLVRQDVFDAITDCVYGNSSFVKEEFVLEFCEFIKNKDKDLYERMISQIVGDFIFDAADKYAVNKGR